MFYGRVHDLLNQEARPMRRAFCLQRNVDCGRDYDSCIIFHCKEVDILYHVTFNVTRYKLGL
jgi:hypothetical protein